MAIEVPIVVEVPPLPKISIANLTPVEVRALSVEQIQSINPTEVATLNPAQLQALTPEQINNFSADQQQSLSPPQKAMLSALLNDAMSSQKALALVTQSAEPLGVTPSNLNPAGSAAATPPAQSPPVTLAMATPAPALVGPAASLGNVAAPNSPLVQATPAATSGVVPVSVLGDARMTSLGMAFEQQTNDIRVQLTTAPAVEAQVSTNLVRFTGNFKTFMVSNERGEMVPYQGAMIGKRMVIVATNEGAKSLARSEMQTVLAAAITSLGTAEVVSLSQLEGVVMDLR